MLFLDTLDYNTFWVDLLTVFNLYSQAIVYSTLTYVMNIEVYEYVTWPKGSNSNIVFNFNILTRK